MRKPILTATAFSFPKAPGFRKVAPGFRKLCSSLFFSLFTGVFALGAAQITYADLSAKIELSSAHSFRGVTQTNNNIAPSVHAKYDHENGIYLGTLVSRNDFRSPSSHAREHAYFLGYGVEVNRNLNLDLSLITYDLPETATGMNRDWREIHVRFNFVGHTALTLGIADDWLRKGKQTSQIEVSHLYSVSQRLSLQGTAGTILASSARGENYLYAELGLIYGISSNAYIRADLSATDSSAKRLFGDRADTDARLSIGYIF